MSDRPFIVGCITLDCIEQKVELEDDYDYEQDDRQVRWESLGGELIPDFSQYGSQYGALQGPQQLVTLVPDSKERIYVQLQSSGPYGRYTITPFSDQITPKRFASLLAKDVKLHNADAGLGSFDSTTVYTEWASALDRDMHGPGLWVVEERYKFTIYPPDLTLLAFIMRYRDASAEASDPLDIRNMSQDVLVEFLSYFSKAPATYIQALMNRYDRHLKNYK